MPRKLHIFLRILIPGGVILAEFFLLYFFASRGVPDDTTVWSFLSEDIAKTTGIAILALALGWIYYAFDVTDKVDLWTIRGMESVRGNIRSRLLAPFRDDHELGPKLGRFGWATLERIFFQFIDETPSLKTTNELAFLSGLLFYSFLDLAIITTPAFAATVIILTLEGRSGLIALSLYAVFLVVVFFIAIAAARSAIKKHKATSNRQIDAILSEQLPALKERLRRSVTTC
jgi:uncharacterized membrane protein